MKTRIQLRWWLCALANLPNSKDDDPDAEPGHAPADRRGDMAAARSRGYVLVARLQQGESPNAAPDRNAEASHA